MTKQHNFQFFGPHVPGLLLVALPGVCYALYLSCGPHGCVHLWPSFELPALVNAGSLFSWEALAVWLSWLAIVLLLHLILPAQKRTGVLLPNGERLTYRLNGWSVLLLLYPSVALLGYLGHLPLAWVHDHSLELLSASLLVSVALSLGLYAASFRRGALLAEEGNTGYPHYDLWMGRELNPRIGGLDLKEFCELYPGMIGWAVLNLCLAFKQHQLHGRVTNSMLLVNAFELLYIADALWFEPGILTTMDIASEGFGFMLAFGDLTWVPFTYTLQARFLVDQPQDLPLWAVSLILALALVGIYIFRASNNQKNTFRTNPHDPSVAHLKTLKTERGTQLIVSGWWGMSRHMNYFGDCLLGVAWCLPTGLPGMSAVVPYFYAIYFATLLIHRSLRDEENCQRKYGKDWDKYCSIVKYRIIPYVY